MDAFLLHSLALAWASASGARQLGAGWAERALVTILLCWANLVVTAVFLSAANHLGEPRWFAALSLGLAVITAVALARVSPPPESAAPGRILAFSAWLMLGFVVLAPLLAGAGLSHEALAHHLPRVRYYLGQGSLAHFATGDALQVWPPFNAHLLLLFPAVHGSPLPVVNPAALAVWAAVALAAGPWFFLRWRRTRLTRHALLAGLAAGLASGSELAWLVPGLACVAAIALVAWRTRTPRVVFGATALALLFAGPFAAANFLATGRLLPTTGIPWFSLAARTQPAAPEPLPALIRHRLLPPDRINVDSDAADEAIFPLLSLRPGQRGKATRRIEPGAYTLISRSRSGRGVISTDPTASVSCALLPIPEKRTAGVELLGTIGSGPAARDYYGLEADAGQQPPLDSTRNALLMVERLPGAPEGRSRLRLIGLNPADALRVNVEADHADWSSTPVASFSADGEQVVTFDRPLRWLTIRVTADQPGPPLATMELPLVAPTSAGEVPVGILPSNASSLLVTELVVRRHDRGMVGVTGLLPTEGPHRHLELPYVRWAGQPVVRLTVPAMPGLARLQLVFSARPQSREQAEFIVRFNGEPAGRYRFEARDHWLTSTLELAATPGENVIEFVDVTTKSDPDWADYLARYPDVKAYLESSHQPLGPGAREHFERHGRAEGRTVHPLPGGAPDVPPESRYLLFRQLRLEGFKAP